MHSMIENYINGNLKDAKRQAKRFSWQRIFQALQDDGYTRSAAVATANYLKGLGTFQAACDAS